MAMENNINVKFLSMAGQGGSAFGVKLMELMKERDDIMVLSADMSTPAGLDKFKATYPDHFMNVGIAEQNMIGIAAGLADEGYKVICVAQACFITMRCFEQVRQYAGYMGIPIKLVGIGSGMSLQYMGNTHYALEDIALMRTIPNMTVMAPCDSLEAMKCLEDAVNGDGSVYIRFFGGTGIPVVHQNDFIFERGKSIVTRKGNDIAILATGSMVHQAMKAADVLSGKGIDSSVVDVHTIKPFDKAIIDEIHSKQLIVVEEHRRVGGLFGMLSEQLLLSKNTPPHILQIGVGEEFPLPGSYAFMLKETGLDAESIAERITRMFN